MDRNLEKYYEQQFEMLSTPGWKDLLITVDQILEHESNINAIKDEKDLFKRQGRVEMLNWLKNWKASCEETFKQLKHEEII